jgi:hypothetical protein
MPSKKCGLKYPTSTQKPKKTGFDQYLEENPDAIEGLMYDT